MREFTMYDVQRVLNRFDFTIIIQSWFAGNDDETDGSVIFKAYDRYGEVNQFYINFKSEYATTQMLSDISVHRHHDASYMFKELFKELYDESSN